MTSSTEKVLTHEEIEEKIKDLTEEEVDFIINVNNIIGNLGSDNFQDAINAVSKAVLYAYKPSYQVLKKG